MKNRLVSILSLGVTTVLLLVLGTALSPDSVYVFLGLALLINVGAYVSWHGETRDSPWGRGPHSRTAHPRQRRTPRRRVAAHGPRRRFALR